MRRTIGAILMLTRPDRIIRSAWRGEARKASKPKRAMSMRAPTMDIISIAQQARPKVAGNIELPRAQRDGLVERRGEDRARATYSSRSSPSRSPRSSVAGAELADARKSAGSRDRLAADYLHSSAPRRQTYTNATISSAMKTTVSMRANVPKARSCTATG